MATSFFVTVGYNPFDMRFSICASGVDRGECLEKVNKNRDENITNFFTIDLEQSIEENERQLLDWIYFLRIPMSEHKKILEVLSKKFTELSMELQR